MISITLSSQKVEIYLRILARYDELKLIVLHNGQFLCVHIFERRPGYKIMKQNMSGSMIFQCFNMIPSKYP